MAKKKNKKKNAGAKKSAAGKTSRTQFKNQVIDIAQDLTTLFNQADKLKDKFGVAGKIYLGEVKNKLEEVEKPLIELIEILNPKTFKR